MKISEKLYKKYATNAVILPPPPASEDLGEQQIPIDKDDLGEGWNSVLVQDSGGLGDPLTEMPNESEEEMLKQLRDSSIPPYEQEMLDLLKKDKQDTPTVPPGKRASSDQILKMCSKYYDLCCKL